MKLMIELELNHLDDAELDAMIQWFDYSRGATPGQDRFQRDLDESVNAAVEMTLQQYIGKFQEYPMVIGMWLDDEDEEDEDFEDEETDLPDRSTLS